MLMAEAETVIYISPLSMDFTLRDRKKKWEAGRIAY